MKKYLILAIVFTLSACKTTKVVAPSPVEELDTSICQFVATLLDYTANQNCGYLFQLADGTKLLPTTMPSVDIGFTNGKKVLIGYREFDATTTRTNSKCSVEDKAVEITCIQDYVDPKKNTPPTLEDCKPVVNVYKSPWMPGIAEKVKPKKIIEHEYAVGYLYLFEAAEVSSLYDCLGNKMCDTTDGGDCKSLISTIGKGKVIQVLAN